MSYYNKSAKRLLVHYMEEVNGSKLSTDQVEEIKSIVDLIVADTLLEAKKVFEETFEEVKQDYNKEI